MNFQNPNRGRFLSSGVLIKLYWIMDPQIVIADFGLDSRVYTFNYFTSAQCSLPLTLNPQKNPEIKGFLQSGFRLDALRRNPILRFNVSGIKVSFCFKEKAEVCTRKRGKKINFATEASPDTRAPLLLRPVPN